jgi:hypothetical protein
MLHAWRHPHTGELRLYIQGVSVEAWISQEKPAGLQHPSVRHGEDWVLWVRHGKTLTLENCPARLQVQSVLRAWLLQTYHRPLFAMRFGELHRIAQLQGARSVHLRS